MWEIVAATGRRPLLLFLAVTLGWVVLSAARPALRAGDGLAAEYFANGEWMGPPAFIVVDSEVSAATMVRRWKDTPPEQFSVRWIGFLTVGSPGRYTFATTSDDGSRLFVNNTRVVENRGLHRARTRTGSIHLDRGSHVIVLEYVQYGGDVALTWSWSRNGGDYSIVPAWALSRRRTPYAIVVVARTIDWARRSFAVLALAAALWRLGVVLTARRNALRLWLDTHRRTVTIPYRNTASLIFSICVYVAMLFVPWPGSQPPFFRAVAITFRDLNTTAADALKRFQAFQADVSTPGSGEYVLPASVRELVAMLRRRGIREFQLSDPIAADSWVLQQMVASAWPSKLETHAREKFVLNGEPTVPGCTVIERGKEVSLVRCR